MSSREGDGLLSPFFLLHSILTTLRVRYTALQGTDMEVASFFGLDFILDNTQKARRQLEERIIQGLQRRGIICWHSSNRKVCVDRFFPPAGLYLDGNRDFARQEFD